MDNLGLTITEIRLASEATTTLLENANYSCCLVGSAAGYEHGITRVPNVDLSTFFMLSAGLILYSRMLIFS
jgi:hypothetical protein